MTCSLPPLRLAVVKTQTATAPAAPPLQPRAPPRRAAALHALDRVGAVAAGEVAEGDAAVDEARARAQQLLDRRARLAVGEQPLLEEALRLVLRRRRRRGGAPQGG